MNRLLTLPGLTAANRGLLRCIVGVLGCIATAGAVSLGTAAPADADALTHPHPNRSLPVECRHVRSTDDQSALLRCRRAWQAMNEEDERSRRTERDGQFRRRHHRHHPHHRHHEPGLHHSPPRWLDELLRQWASTHPGPGKTAPKPSSPRAAAETTPRKATPARSAEPTASPRAERSSGPSAQPSRPRTPAPVPTLSQADDIDTSPPSLQSVLLLGLLIPAVAAMCFPFRHRLYAASTGASRSPIAEAPAPPRALPEYRPSLDPFAVPALGLTGPGAPAAARVLAVTALEVHGATSLVVIPRPDTTVLFGLAEDELLDDDSAALFIPGNLDAALAYLETELAIRENTGVTDARRLLLVADPEEETDRIKALLERHPGGVSVILLGTWTDAQVTVDDDGLVSAPPGLAAHLPERLPALSRTVARDRLFASLAHQKEPRRTPSKRRSNSRRT